MITINLLPQQKRAVGSRMGPYLVASVLGALMLGGGLGGSYWYFDAQVQDLRRIVQEKTQTKTVLVGQIGKANQYVAELEAVQKRIKVIQDIRVQQGLPVRYLDALVSSMPPERLWFESLSLGGDGRMSLSGVALDNQAFAAYVEALRRSPFVAQVDTQRTSRRDIGGRGLVAFVCSVLGRDPGPVSQAPTQGGSHG